jgi:hypothetical protein
VDGGSGLELICFCRFAAPEPEGAPRPAIADGATPQHGAGNNRRGRPAAWRHRIARGELVSLLAGGLSAHAIGARYGLHRASVGRAIDDLSPEEWLSIVKGRVTTHALEPVAPPTALPRLDPLAELLGVLEGAKGALKELDKVKAYLGTPAGKRALKPGSRLSFVLATLDRRYFAHDRIIKAVAAYLDANEKIVKVISFDLWLQAMKDAIAEAQAELNDGVARLLEDWRAGRPAPEAFEPPRIEALMLRRVRERRATEAIRSSRVVVGAAGVEAAAEDPA